MSPSESDPKIASTDSSKADATSDSASSNDVSAETSKDSSESADATDSSQEAVQTADDKKTDEQPHNEQTVENGTYVIATGSNGFEVVDIDSGSKEDGANAWLYSANGTDAQKYGVEWHSDEGGYYTIKNVNSGKYLDVEWGSTDNGANVWQYASNGSKAQRWLIRRNADGTYGIISLLSKRALDVRWGEIADCSNLWLYDDNGSAAQKFRFLKAAASLDISDGVYEIVSGLDAGKAIDINSGSMGVDNVQIYDVNGMDAQHFILTKTGDSYRITNLNSGLVVDLAGASSVPGTNVQQYYANGTNAQSWFINNTGDGYVYFRSAAAPANVIDIANASTANCSNVWAYTANGSLAQKFILKRVAYTPLTGEYAFHYGAERNKVIDIMNGSRKVGAVAQLYESNGTLAQKFVVGDAGDGFVTIRNANSGHVLEVRYGSRDRQAPVWQYSSNGSMAQKWIAHRNPDGSYTFINANSSLVLEGDGGLTLNGLNFQQYTYNGSAGQRFYLTNETGYNNFGIDYGIESQTDINLVEKGILDRIGWNLRAAYNYSMMPYVHMEEDWTLGTTHYAWYGLGRHSGNCYVMAATFRALATRLGYNVIQVSGYHPERSGNVIHSWDLINGLVYDPDFEYELGLTGYGLRYGQPKTLRYVEQYYMPW